MSLLPCDKQYLDELGYEYEIVENENPIKLIIKNYEVSSAYDKEYVDVLIQIPKGYPNTQLDMFWVYPYVKFKNNGCYPPQADYFQDILDRKWQRFSRHYKWKPIYNLSTHMNLVRDVIYNGRG